MSTLGRWLVGILNAHIERHNMPAAEPVHVTSTSEPGGHVFEVYPSAKPMLDEIAGLSWEPTGRPCWVCGYDGGFHVEHECDSHFDTTGGAARRAAART